MAGDLIWRHQAGLRRAGLRCGLRRLATAPRPAASAPPPSPPPSPTPADADVEQSVGHVLRVVWPHLWPAHRPEIRTAVLASLGLMAGSKLATVSTPLIFKEAVDTLAAGVAAGMPDAAAATSASAADATAVTALSAAAASGGAPESALASALSALAPAVPSALLLLGAYGLLRVASVGMQELRNSTFASVAACASRSLGRELFARLHALDATYHARNPPGALSRVVERSSRAASALLSVVVLHIAPTALELGLVTALLSSQCGPLFGGVAVATVGGYVVFTFAVTTRRNAIRRRLNRADNALHAELADALSNRVLIQLHNGFALAGARFEARLQQHESAQLDVAHSLALLNFGQAAILSGGVAAVTLLAASGCLQGTLSLGDVVLANQLLLGLSAPLNVLGMVYREFTSAVTDLSGALDILQQPQPQIGASRGGGASAGFAGDAGRADVASRGGGVDGGAGGSDVNDDLSLSLSAAEIKQHGIEFENVRFEYPPQPARPPAAAAGAAAAAVAAAAGAAVGSGAGRAALDGVSFRVPFGRSVAIVGGSGSGKSTVLALASALASPTAGIVRIGGRDAASVPPAALRARVAVVSQDARFFRESVGFNIGYPLLAARARAAAAALSGERAGGSRGGGGGRMGETGAGRASARRGAQRLIDANGVLSTLLPAEREAVHAAAERAQLQPTVAALAAGYATDIGEGGSRLSGGEKQRVSLARALTRVAVGGARAAPTAGVGGGAAGEPGAANADGGPDGIGGGGDGSGFAEGHRPDASGSASSTGEAEEERALILLCDEPTSALDVLTEAKVLAELRAVAPHVCMLLVTHRLASCVLTDEVIVLRDGKVAERGSHAELAARPGGEYARMWRTQMAEEDRGLGELDRE